MKIFSQQTTIGKHTKAVTALKYSPSEDLLISASADQTCYLYRSQDNTRIAMLGERTPINHEAAGGEEGPTAERTALAGGDVVKKGHSEGINDVVWLQNCNDSTLATASDDKQIKIWDVETRAVVSTLSGHESFVFSLAAHPSQSYLVSGSEDETLRLWDLRCAAHQVHSLEAHAEPVSCVAFHPTGDHIVSSSYDGLVRVWDFRTLACRRTLTLLPAQGGSQASSQSQIQDHSENLSTPAPISHVQYTPNGNFLLTSCLDGTLRLLRPFHTHLYSTPLATEREHYNANVSQRDAYMINIHKRIKRTCPVRSIQIVKTFSGHMAKKYSCPATFVDASTAVEESRSACDTSVDSIMEKEKEMMDMEEMSDRRHKCNVMSTLLLSGSEDNDVCVWNLQTEELVERLQGHTAPVLALHHSHKHQQAVSGGGGGDGSVRVWGRGGDGKGEDGGTLEEKEGEGAL